MWLAFRHPRFKNHGLRYDTGRVDVNRLLCDSGLDVATRKSTCQLLQAIPSFFSGGLIILISAIALIGVVNPNFSGLLYGATKPVVTMNVISIFGFILSGFAFIFLGTSLKNRASRRFIELVTVVTGAIGAIGMLSYVVNLDYLYVTFYSMRMSFPTALMFVFLALGLNGLSHRTSWDVSNQLEISPKQIYHTVDRMLIFIVASVSLIVFGLSQGRTERLMSDQMTVLIDSA